MGVNDRAVRSCATCKDAKVLCDRALPSCLRCVKARRVCKGYALRLSWPSKVDGRRAIVARRSSHLPHTTPRTPSVHFISLSHWDIEMYHHLATSESRPSMAPVLHIEMPFNPFGHDPGQASLLYYFQHVVCHSLAILGHEPKSLGQVLLRMAQPSDSPSSTALLNAILSLSAMHRDGLTAHAFNYKIVALRDLGAASSRNLIAREVSQHIATIMLLCSFEIHRSSCTSSQGVWYVAGATELCKSPCLDACRNEEEIKMLASWVYYHNVIARFALRHWERDFQHVMATPMRIWKEAYTRLLSADKTCFEIDRSPGTSLASLATLDTLCNICITFHTKPDKTNSHDREPARQSMQHLENVRSLAAQQNTTEPLLELFHLSMLVYLLRVCRSLLGQASDVDSLVARAFQIFSRLESCERQWPLLVLGREAYTEEQRAIVLSLINRTERSVSSRSLNHTRIIVQALWSQDDLADQAIDYWANLTSVITCCSVVPSFV